MNPEIEQAFVKAFILPARRSRWLELLASKKGRERLVKRLCHECPLDPRFAHLIPSNQHAKDIEKSLQLKGAPATCYSMSASPDLDGRVMPLGEALLKVVGYGMGTLLSCIPGQL